MPDHDREWVIFGVPIDCVGAPTPGHQPFGTELSPGAMRAAGVVAAVGGVDEGDLGVRLTSRVRDTATGVLGWPGVVEMTRAVREKVRQVVSTGRVPVVLGGCCSLLPGALAGARDQLGPIGLAYLDGHLDLYDGKTSTTGEPADMPMAVISGHGPRAWVDEVGGPLVPAAAIVLVGPRDRDEAVELGSVLPEQLGIATELTPAELRRRRPVDAGATIVDQLVSSGARYWVHLDVDVLDEREFPATDYLMPGGLARDELTALLGPLTRHPGLAGFSVGCYNPEKDPDGGSGRYLVDLLATSLGPAPRPG